MTTSDCQPARIYQRIHNHRRTPHCRSLEHFRNAATYCHERALCSRLPMACRSELNIDDVELLSYLEFRIAVFLPSDASQAARGRYTGGLCIAME